MSNTETKLTPHAIALRAIAALEVVADQLDQWAEESQRGGWSTHQVDPMRRVADQLRRDVSRHRRALNEAQ